MAQQWAAGERITAGKLSTLTGDPVVRETNSATFTSETVVDTITVSVVEGRRYKIVLDNSFQSSVADGYVRARIREDDVSGTVLQLRQRTTTVAGQAMPLHMEAFWTATATEDKTFVGTALRQAGTGNITAIGVGTPALFYVENA